MKAYTNCGFIVKEGYGFQDGLFTGYDEDKRDYDKATWEYEIGPDGFAVVDPTLQGNADFAPALAWLLDYVDLSSAPEAAKAAAMNVRAMPDEERSTLATDIMAGAYPLDRVAETLFVAAALQVHLARLAARLDGTTVQPAADGVCPACGGAPVSSLVVGWTAASKARYYACSLCGTLERALDPVADDVASYALDLLAREQDFRRSGINPLLLTG